MTTSDQQALTDALSAEYAAVYAYGIIAAFANHDRDRLVAESTAAHRARRDATIDTLKSLGANAPAPAAAYTTPFVVDDPIPAAKLAVTVESDTAAVWRSAVERADTPKSGTSPSTLSPKPPCDWPPGSPSSAPTRSRSPFPASPDRHPIAAQIRPGDNSSRSRSVRTRR